MRELTAVGRTVDATEVEVLRLAVAWAHSAVNFDSFSDMS